MRELKNSDIFDTQINKSNKIFNKLNMILTGLEPSTVILNEILYSEIKKKIVDKKKEPSENKMLECILNGKMVLFLVAPDKNLPGAIPFFNYKQNGMKKVAVNLTNIVHPVKQSTGEVEYEMNDVNKVYAIIYSAYLTLEALDPKSVLSPDALLYSSILWAEMFCKPMFDAVGLNNIDRKKAFMYFSIKFFLTYYMECPEDQVESLSRKYVGDKNDLILYMEEQISTKGIDIYAGITDFCRMLFNNEITLIKGIKVNNVSNSMNISFYLSKFVQTYSSNALLSLCAYPYFVYTILAAKTKCGLVKDKSFERIFKDNAKMADRMILEVRKESR